MASLPKGDDNQGTVTAFDDVVSTAATATRAANYKWVMNDYSGGAAAFTASDYDPAGVHMLTLFTGSLGASNVTAPTITRVEAGPFRIVGIDDDAAAPGSDSLLTGGYLPDSDFIRLLGLVNAGTLLYVIERQYDVALRYVLGREARLTDLSQGEPYRLTVQPMDERVAHTNRTQIRALLVTAQDNADALALGETQPIVNQRFDLEPDGGKTLESVTLGSATGWTTIARAGCYIERGYQRVVGSFDYVAAATTATPLAVQARLMIVNDDDTTASTGTSTGDAVDMQRAQSFIDLGSTDILTAFDDWWPGTWWHDGVRRHSPQMDVDTTSCTGTPKALHLQVRSNFTEPATITINLLGWSAVGQARR